MKTILIISILLLMSCSSLTPEQTEALKGAAILGTELASDLAVDAIEGYGVK